MGGRSRRPPFVSADVGTHPAPPEPLLPARLPSFRDGVWSFPPLRKGPGVLSQSRRSRLTSPATQTRGQLSRRRVAASSETRTRVSD